METETTVVKIASLKSVLSLLGSLTLNLVSRVQHILRHVTTCGVTAWKNSSLSDSLIPAILISAALAALVQSCWSFEKSRISSLTK